MSATTGVGRLDRRVQVPSRSIEPPRPHEKGRWIISVSLKNQGDPNCLSPVHVQWDAHPNVRSNSSSTFPGHVSPRIRHAPCSPAPGVDPFVPQKMGHYRSVYTVYIHVFFLLVSCPTFYKVRPWRVTMEPEHPLFVEANCFPKVRAIR